MNNETAADREPYPIVVVNDINMEIQSLAMELVELQQRLAVVSHASPVNKAEEKYEKSPDELQHSPLVSRLLKLQRDVANITKCACSIKENLDL